MLRIAIVGGGKMAQHHARAVAETGLPAEVRVVVDPVKEARDGMLEHCPRASAFSNLEAALAEAEIDVVHICTPPHLHARLAVVALEAGCHVYVEKPFAETLEDAERLRTIAAERQLKLCAGHQLLFEAPAVRARQLLPMLGTIVHIESYFSFRPVRRSRGGGRPMQVEEQLLDVLPHPVYLVLAFLRQAAPVGKTELRGVEVGRAGTVHVLLGRGELNASLVITLAGRPVESYLRLVGDNGLVVSDFVRGTTQRLIGPGSSGVDKLLNPFRLARQLGTQTTLALSRRFVRRRRSYPGLTEIFTAFYEAIESGYPSPIAADEIVETVDICERIGRALPGDGGQLVESAAPAAPSGDLIAVTGGTGFLGRAVVETLTAQRVPVRALARRVPPRWDQVAGVDYVTADLGADTPGAALAGVHTVIHCAAETAGGWAEHQANSLDATENLLRAAAAAGVRHVVHVSSLAVLDGGRQPVNESTPLLEASRSRGPYVWGKLESEMTATQLAPSLGLAVKVVRPGALVDYSRFDPPGRLGRRVGNVFVAVGRRRDELGVTSLRFCADALAWMSRNFEQAPDAINIIEPEIPTKRELVGRLRERNPDLMVVWLPRVVLRPLSWLGLGVQRVLRPGVPPIDVAKVFSAERYDVSVSEALAHRMSSSHPDSKLAPGSEDPAGELRDGGDEYELGDLTVQPMKRARRR